MKHNYLFNHWLYLVGVVVALLLSQTPAAQAQLYYVITDGNLATTADQLRRVNLDGSNNVLIKDNFIESPGTIVLDAANNRLLVANVAVTNAGNPDRSRIIAVGLGAGNPVSTLATTGLLSGATTTQITGLAVDAVNGYLYYVITDGNLATTADQLRRVNLDGSNNVLIKDNFIESPGTIVLDAANNRLLVANVAVTNAGNPDRSRIIAVGLGAGNPVSTLATTGLLSGATTTQITGLAIPNQTSPTVTTNAPSGITTTGATLSGNVTGNGGAEVTERGIVFSSINSNPTIGGSNVMQNSNGSGTGTFSATISTLAAGTTYFVRAYATNSVGTSYGSVQTFTTTPNAPIVTTPANGSLLNTTTPTYTGTAQANATVTVYVDGTSIGTTTANGSGNFNLAQPSALSQGSHTVRATAMVGSSAPSISSNTNTFTVDTTPPAAPVALTPANGSFINTTTPSYAGTAEANSTVTILVDGTSIGTTTANASGNWSRTQPTALTQGSHTVRATATDVAGNTSVSSNTNTFTVDSVRPTVTIGSSAQNPTNTSPIPFTITFSETVTDFVVGDLTVTGGTITSFSGSGTTYTFSVTLATSGVVTVELPANVAQDNAGNGNTAASPLSITYNQPVTAAPVLGQPATGSSLNTATPTYAGTAPPNATVTIYVDGSSIGTTAVPGSGTFGLTQPTALSQGSHTVYATAQLSGQAVSASSNTNTFIVDTVAPTVSSVGVPANGAYRTGQTLLITVNVSEPVTVTGTPRVGLTIGASSRQANYVSGSGTRALLFSYIVLAGDLDTDGVTLGALTLNDGTIRDGAGNEATLTLNNVSSTAGVLVDGVVPFVSSSNRQNPTGSLTNGTAVVFRVSFSEAVTGVNNGSFALTTTDGSVTGTIVSTQPVNNTSNSQYDVIVNEVSGNGILRLDVNSSGSGITDLAGNPIPGGFTSGQTFTIDQVHPTVTISSSAGPNAGTTRTSPIPFTVTFSESVAEFVGGDITLTNGTLLGFAGSGTTYTFTVTPLANGPVTVNIAANVAQDAAINGNTAASPYSISYLPLTLTGFAPLSPSVCVGSPLAFTATVSNADGPYSYTLTNGTNPITGMGSGTTFSRTITAAGEGGQSFTLVVVDASQRVSASQLVTVNPLPAVSITGLASAYCKDAATVTLVGSPAGGNFTIDGNPATQLNPAALTVGIHTVVYSYTNNSGCSQTTSQTVTVKEVPNAPVVATQSGQSTVTVDLNTGNVTLLITGCAGSINWTGPNTSAGTSNAISVPTTQAGTFVYQANCTVNGCTGPLATATVTVGARLTVLHRDVDNYADNNAIQPLLVLQNNSTGSLPLSRVTLRYYVTVEGGGALGNLSMNYAQVGNQNVRLRYVALNPAQQGATGYVEYSFTEGAGSLAAGADSGPIQSYFTKSDYGPLNELDDYSYNPVRNQLTGNLRITAYYDGALIAGVEPGSSAQIRAVRALTESKNGPSATQISTYLEVRNEGNVAINYSDLKARYYFTSDGNERLQVEVDEGNVSARLVKLPQAVNGADSYLELTFNQSGQLAPGATTGTIRYRISKPDGGRFNQANDYSYQEQPQDRSQNSRVVVYAGNDRIWGQEPSGSARVAYVEAGQELSVKVLGNPIQNEEVSFEVTGAEGQALQLQLLTPQGRVVHQQQIPSAEATQRHQFSVAGQAGGLFLLHVSTLTQSKTVKVLKAN